MSEALLIVDAQVDFCPGGKLAIPHGDEIIPVVNRHIRTATTVVASRDWHKPGVDYGWPEHCVQGTSGAQYHPGLNVDGITFEVLKGDGLLHPYGAFYADNERGVLLPTHAYLQGQGVHKLKVCGLATDYCVKTTVLDALHLSYLVVVLVDACRGLELATTQAALAEMKAAGAVLKATNEEGESHGI